MALLVHPKVPKKILQFCFGAPPSHPAAKRPKNNVTKPVAGKVVGEVVNAPLSTRGKRVVRGVPEGTEESMMKIIVQPHTDQTVVCGCAQRSQTTPAPPASQSRSRRLVLDIVFIFSFFLVVVKNEGPR